MGCSHTYLGAILLVMICPNLKIPGRVPVISVVAVENALSEPKDKASVNSTMHSSFWPDTKTDRSAETTDTRSKLSLSEEQKGTRSNSAMEENATRIRPKSLVEKNASQSKPNSSLEKYTTRSEPNAPVKKIATRRSKLNSSLEKYTTRSEPNAPVKKIATRRSKPNSSLEKYTTRSEPNAPVKKTATRRSKPNSSLEKYTTRSEPNAPVKKIATRRSKPNSSLEKYTTRSEPNAPVKKIATRRSKPNSSLEKYTTRSEPNAPVKKIATRRSKPNSSLEKYTTRSEPNAPVKKIATRRSKLNSSLEKYTTRSEPNAPVKKIATRRSKLNSLVENTTGSKLNSSVDKNATRSKLNSSASETTGNETSTVFSEGRSTYGYFDHSRSGLFPGASGSPMTQSSQSDSNITTSSATLTEDAESDCQFNACARGLHLTDSNGTLTLPERCCWQSNCSSFSFSWHIELPEGNGAVIQINKLVFPGQMSIKSDNATQHFLGRWLRSNTLDAGPHLVYPIAPVCVPHHNLTITLTLVTAHTDDMQRSVQAECNISYMAHRLQDIPNVAEVEESEDPRFPMYNCSNISNIPAPMKCDRVKQCIGGEDETACRYRKSSCGDWVSLGDKCIAVLSGNSSKNNCRSAIREACPEDAQLAVLLSGHERKVVASLVTRSGFFGAVVALNPVQASSWNQYLYRYLWQWDVEGRTVAHDLPPHPHSRYDADQLPVITGYHPFHFVPIFCYMNKYYYYYDKVNVGYVCMKKNDSSSPSEISKIDVHIPRPLRNTGKEKIEIRQCADGSYVYRFHRCPPARSGTDSSDSEFPYFPCDFGHYIHYTLVCDGFSDCMDGKDESTKICRDLTNVRCDVRDCVDDQSRNSVCRSLCASDNENPIFFQEFFPYDPSTCSESSVWCPQVTTRYLCSSDQRFPPTMNGTFTSCERLERKHTVDTNNFIIDLDGYGFSRRQVLKGSCPETHYQCKSGFCIPTYLLKNGERDCPEGDDENILEGNFTCPGFYRCQKTWNCLHSDFLCDGMYQCPYKDDELYCNLTCPVNCSCEGYAYRCSKISDANSFPKVRLLDLSGLHNPLKGLQKPMNDLILLNLSHCALETVSITGKKMPKLGFLDLSFNNLKNLSDLKFIDLQALMLINLTGNAFGFGLGSEFRQFLIDAGIIRLETLILRNTSIKSVSTEAFNASTALQTLDLSRNQIDHFQKDVFQGLKLRKLTTDIPRMCCPYFHPSVTTLECHAPEDELSSCGDLLRDDFFRVCLWGVSVIAIVGNAVVLAYRLFMEECSNARSFQILVVNLCVSDFLMGVYLAIIGAADFSFRGIYVEKEKEWRQSGTCQVAGFLAMLSSEMSALVICLITLDRFLVTGFPLKSHLHLNTRSTLLACGCAWLVCVLLAAVPFMSEATEHWQFYNQNGICLPLPITRLYFPGYKYAFGVFIIFNFVLFLVTGAGQMSIYYNIRKARKEAGNQRRQQDMTIARRLFLIVFTDFCCWFPIGVMGLLASKGTPVPGVVNVWAAVFVLPLNSALNPFLYTLITLQARREKMRMENMVQRTLHRLKLEVLKWPDDKVEDLLQYLVKAKASQRLRLMSEQGNTLAVTNSEKDRISTSEQITQVSDLEVELRQANKEVTSDTAENSETTSV